MDPSTTPPAGAPERPALQPGDRFDVTIERPAALGRGVARVDGLTVLVARGVPGEAVTVEVERAFPRYALARVASVQRPALARTTPPCPHFFECGGCDWQQVDYPTQLGIKRAVLAEQLERIGHLQAPPEWSLVPAPQPLAYRDKLEFTPVLHEGRYAPGFHDLSGQRVVPIEHCHLAPQGHTRLAQGVLHALQEAGALPVPSGGEAIAHSPLQRLTVQGCELPGGSPGLAVLLHLRATRGASEGRLRRTWQQAARAVLPRLRREFAELAAFAVQFPARMGRGQRRSGPTVEVLYGPRHLTKRVHGRAYRVPHTAFFQVHPEMAGALVAHAVEQVQGALSGAEPEVSQRVVYDLFGGVGLFALPLAERGLRVVGVDSDREGLRAGEETARGLGLDSVTFLRGDLERAETFAQLLVEHGPPAAVLCDPPRRGLAAPLAEALATLPPASAPAAIVYVSCDGGTFARDAARLAPAWRLSALRGFDLFPQTHHLELVGTFVRAAEG